MTFKPGRSGNINGRPPGTGHRQQIFNNLVLPHKEDLINKAIQMAKEGNEAMLRLLLDRMLPAKPTDEPITIDLPEGDFKYIETLLIAREGILKDIAAGNITTKEGRNINAILDTYFKNIAYLELKSKLEEVKSMMSTSQDVALQLMNKNDDDED